MRKCFTWLRLWLENDHLFISARKTRIGEYAREVLRNREET